MCTFMCIYIYIHRHSTDAQLPTPLSPSSLHCAGVHSARVHPVLDPWKYQVAKCAFSAGPDLGSLSSHHRFESLPPLLLREHQLDVLYAMAALRHPQPRGDTSHFYGKTAGFSPWVSNLLAPSLQFQSPSTYSNQARAPSAASST